jgi:Protein of unknown function (DUF3168)
MSYGVSGALQSAVFQQLVADAALGALVSGQVFDAAPPGVAPPLYVSLGPEKVADRSDQSSQGATHDFTVSVVSDSAGFLAAKEVAALVSDLLSGASLSLTRGVLVALMFRTAKARRVQQGDVRRIDLTFRALVEDD